MTARLWLALNIWWVAGVTGVTRLHVRPATALGGIDDGRASLVSRGTPL
jgi:hypothetical protein